MRRVLTIAGSDPTGGAGLEADLGVFRLLGTHGMAVATALTVQDTRCVHEVGAVDPAHFERRLGVLLAGVEPHAVKVGMLATGAIASCVARALAGLPESVPVVVDPVIRSTSGAELLDAGGLDILRREILPRATVVTPNRDEALALTGLPAGAAGAAIGRALARLAPPGTTFVITGGAGGGPEAIDLVTQGGSCRELRGTRIGARSPHGTGCAFASAIAAGLALGRPLGTVLEEAKLFVARAIERAEKVSPEGRALLVF